VERCSCHMDSRRRLRREAGLVCGRQFRIQRGRYIQILHRRLHTPSAPNYFPPPVHLVKNTPRSPVLAFLYPYSLYLTEDRLPPESPSVPESLANIK
jgi:hypothetical protein